MTPEEWLHDHHHLWSYGRTERERFGGGWHLMQRIRAITTENRLLVPSYLGGEEELDLAGRDAGPVMVDMRLAIMRAVIQGPIAVDPSCPA